MAGGLKWDDRASANGRMRAELTLDCGWHRGLKCVCVCVSVCMVMGVSGGRGRTFEARMTSSRFLLLSQLPIKRSVAPWVSAAGGTGYISAAGANWASGMVRGGLWSVSIMKI
jgi:hypothetical protein